MYIANVETTGGYISGEVKLAASLRLLAGGYSFDLAVFLTSILIMSMRYYIML